MTTNLPDSNQLAVRRLEKLDPELAREIEQDDPLLHELAIFIITGGGRNPVLFAEVYRFLERYFTDVLFADRVDKELMRDEACLRDPAVRARLMGAAA
jgi:hypothetical protein